MVVQWHQQHVLQHQPGRAGLANNDLQASVKWSIRNFTFSSVNVEKLNIGMRHRAAIHTNSSSRICTAASTVAQWHQQHVVQQQLQAGGMINPGVTSDARSTSLKRIAFSLTAIHLLFLGSPLILQLPLGKHPNTPASADAGSW